MEGYDYEVFLSYKGLDMRAGFTNHLYTHLTDVGVRTYRDDEDLRVSEEISPDLLRAMEQSKIFIPIFSKSYASSKWCLKELTQMVECGKRKRQVIMPIFYDVEPSEVRNQAGVYGNALLAHEDEKRVDGETIRKWRAALKEVGGLKGWNIQDVANRHEGQLVKEVVTEVLSELKKPYMVLGNFLAGVDDSDLNSLEKPSSSIIEAESSSEVTNTTDFPTGPHRWRLALDKHVSCLEFLQT